MGQPVIKHTSREDVLHVVPSSHGGWMVKRGGAPVPLESFRQKHEAVSYARGLDHAVVIHDRIKLTYARDSSGKLSRFASLAGEKPRPTFGSAAGLVRIADNFDAPLDDFGDYME